MFERGSQSLRERAAHRKEQRELRQQRQTELDQARAEEEALPVLAPTRNPAVQAPRRAARQVPEYDDRRVTVIVNEAPVMLWSPGLAGIFSLFLPGLGQLYKRQPFNAILWFVFVGLGYVALIVPGLVLHFCCVLGALSGNPMSRR